MRRLRVLAAVLFSAWWGVLLVPGAEAEAPEATGWWAQGRTTPISHPIQTPNDYVPDAVPSTVPRLGGTPLPQVPTVTTLPSTVPDAVTTPQTPFPVDQGELYVGGAHVRFDGSQVPLSAIPDQIRSPDPRIPWPIPPQKTPEQVPQEVDDQDTEPVVVGVSALRLFVGDDAAVGDLVLEIDQHVGTVAVQACVPAYVWAPEEGGPFDSRPRENCAEGLAFGTHEGQDPTLPIPIGGVVRIPLGGLVRDGMLDVVLLPQRNTAFHAVFKKPGPKSIEVTRYPGANEGGGEETPFFFELGCDCPLGDVPFSAGGIAGDLFAPSVDPAVFAPQPPASGQSRRVGLPSGDGLIRNTVSELEPWQKGVAAAVLAGLVTVYFFLVRPPGALPLALGPLAGRRREDDDVEPSRGIGRFARPRAGIPPRL
jgi:hypothetical protein